MWAILEQMLSRLQDSGIIGAYTIKLLVRDVHLFIILPEVTVSREDLVHPAVEFVWDFLVLFARFGVGSQNLRGVIESHRWGFFVPFVLFNPFLLEFFFSFLLHERFGGVRDTGGEGTWKRVRTSQEH